jgi:hypothetical protein
MKTKLLIIFLSALNWATFAHAQTASPLPPTDNYADFGPFETISVDNTGPDGTYTIVRPETLGEDGFLHAPIIFGPGIGGPVASMMNLLERIASHVSLANCDSSGGRKLIEPPTMRFPAKLV